jgi:hypothetical protein
VQVCLCHCYQPFNAVAAERVLTRERLGNFDVRVVPLVADGARHVEFPVGGGHKPDTNLRPIGTGGGPTGFSRMSGRQALALLLRIIIITNYISFTYYYYYSLGEAPPVPGRARANGAQHARRSTHVTNKRVNRCTCSQMAGATHTGVVCGLLEGVLFVGCVLASLCIGIRIASHRCVFNHVAA